MPKSILGEFFGTFVLIFLGCGAGCAAITTEGQLSLFHVAMVWGAGVTTAIYLTGTLSGAHLNPAVTVAMAVWSDFPKRRIVPYIFAQFCGAFAAASVLYFLFSGALCTFEQANGITRGQPGSEASAMVFGEYFPNPGGHPITEQIRARVPSSVAFGGEVIGTAILLLVIFCVTDVRNKTHPPRLNAVTIGLTVTLLISIFSPITMACFNPVRDLAPRVFSSLAGWGAIPFQVNGWGWLTVYVIAPTLGALLGGALYHVLFKRAYRGE